MHQSPFEAKLHVNEGEAKKVVKWFRRDCYCSNSLRTCLLITQRDSRQSCFAQRPVWATEPVRNTQVMLIMYPSDAECLASELLSSPEVHRLIRSPANSEDAQNIVLDGSITKLEGSEPTVSPTAVLATASTLFRECQEMTCQSCDTTLAITGLADQDATILQIHRYLLLHHFIKLCNEDLRLTYRVRDRCVLAARCPFFRALFSTTWTELSSDHIAVSTEEASRNLLASSSCQSRLSCESHLVPCLTAV